MALCRNDTMGNRLVGLLLKGEGADVFVLLQMRCFDTSKSQEKRQLLGATAALFCHGVPKGI